MIARTALDELHDQLYVLACAVEDTDSDLAAVDGAPSATELRRMLDWLLERGPTAGDPRSPAPRHPQFRHDEIARRATGLAARLTSDALKSERAGRAIGVCAAEVRAATHEHSDGRGRRNAPIIGGVAQRSAATART